VSGPALPCRAARGPGGRSFERLEPYPATGTVDGRTEVVAQERLRDDGRALVRRLFEHVDVEDCWSPDMDERRTADWSV
jgi:hypothetical protein